MTDAPPVHGLDLFEHYEASGNLLIVTSDKTTIRMEPGDFIVRRPWATAAPVLVVNRARGGDSDAD